MKDRGAFEVSQVVWALFLVLNVSLTFLSREVVRQTLERRWRAGIGLKRILIVGAGELGPARRRQDPRAPRDWGTTSSGSSTIAPSRTTSATAGCRCSARPPRSSEICQRERVDQIYVALPLEEHHRMLDVIEAGAKNLIDVKIVPDLLQFIALRARIEDMDGVPIINLNDVPLQGLSAMAKRAVDIGCLRRRPARPRRSRSAIVALVIRLTSPRPGASTGRSA